MGASQLAPNLPEVLNGGFTISIKFTRVLGEGFASYMYLYYETL